MLRYLGPLFWAVSLIGSAVAHADDPTAPSVVATPAPATAASPIESQTHHWEFGTSIRAVGGPCAGLFGTFPVPTEWPEQQVKVASEQISPLVAKHAYRGQDGLKQMVFEVPQLPNGATAECFITYEITKHSQNPPTTTANLVVPKDVPRDVKRFLNSSPLIESTNVKVRSLARDWIAGKETAWEQVQAILDGVRDKVKFEQDPKDKFKGALGALRDGKADREDMTATFVAACRAAKIPARMVWVPDYCYAEFYLEEQPGSEDAPAAGEPAAKDAKGAKDAKDKKSTKASKEPKGAWYPAVVHEQEALGACRDFRPILQKGDNFKVPEDKLVQRYIKEFLTGKGGTGGKPAVEFRRRNAD